MRLFVIRIHHMSTRKVLSIAALLLVFICTSVFAAEPRWTFRAHDIIAKSKKTSRAYCLARTPNIFTTTLEKLQKKRVRANNGIRIQFKTFKPYVIRDLHLIAASGYFYRGKKRFRVFAYGQKVSKGGATDFVWSASKCKGKFTAKLYRPAPKKSKSKSKSKIKKSIKKKQKKKSKNEK